MGLINGVPYSGAAVAGPSRAAHAGTPAVGGRRKLCTDFRDSPNERCGSAWRAALEVGVRGSRAHELVGLTWIRSHQLASPYAPVILLLMPWFLVEDDINELVPACFACAMAGWFFRRCQGTVSASSGLFIPRTTDPRKSFS